MTRWAKTYTPTEAAQLHGIMFVGTACGLRDTRQCSVHKGRKVPEFSKGKGAAAPYSFIQRRDGGDAPLLWGGAPLLGAPVAPLGRPTHATCRQLLCLREVSPPYGRLDPSGAAGAGWPSRRPGSGPPLSRRRQAQPERQREDTRGQSLFVVQSEDTMDSFVLMYIL